MFFVVYFLFSVVFSLKEKFVNNLSEILLNRIQNNTLNSKTIEPLIVNISFYQVM